MRKVDPKVEEAVETLNMKDGPSSAQAAERHRAHQRDRRRVGPARCVQFLEQHGARAAKSAAGNFPKTPAWQFWFINHVTTNLFFVPTQYGFADAAALLGIPKPKWGGSQNSIVPQMVSYMNTAIAGKANGIAVPVISSTAFTTPVANAMNAGIPVVTYNADGAYTINGTPQIGTNRLCYVGQALYLSGQQLGERIKSLVTTPGDVVIFIATPGAGNIQPRFDGAASVLTPAGYHRPLLDHGRGRRPVS